MAKKNETTKKAQESAEALAKDFQKILSKHGFDKHAITKFSITSSAVTSTAESVSGCPPPVRRVSRPD